MDSILIDEARTPLIISGPLDDRSELYNTINTFIPKLEKEQFRPRREEPRRHPDRGWQRTPRETAHRSRRAEADSLYDVENVTVVHHAHQALRAHTLFQRDRDYIVKDDEVIIVDEFTGRMMQAAVIPKACIRRSRPRST